MGNLMILRSKLADAEIELDDLYSMSDEAACFRYNTDSKESAIEMVRDWIEWLITDIERAEEAEATPNTEYHFAFPTEASFWNYKGF